MTHHNTPDADRTPAPDATIAERSARTDPAGDFLTIYPGPTGGDLDVTAVDAHLRGPDEVVLVGTHAAPIGTTPGAAYVWGIDRGAGTERLTMVDPPTGEGVAFDAAVVVLPDGTGLIADLVSGGPPQPLDPSSIEIAGSTISVSLPRSLLPSQGRDFADYGYNLWPRFAPDGFDPNNNLQVTDLAPDTSTFTARALGPVGGSAPIFGTPGDDALSGTAGPDRIIGGDGVDVLIGGGSGDGLEGGTGGDVQLGQGGNDFLAGGPGGDVLDGGNGDDALFGDDGNDLLEGGDGADLLAGGPGVDRLTSGGGADVFRFDGDPFNATAPAAAAAVAVPGVNLPDAVADFVVGEDRFALEGRDFGLESLTFANGALGDLAGDANILVLQGTFANAGAAARAIADNDALTADAGAFIYHNSTLGLNRLVYSSDLGDGGAFSVQANLTGQAGGDGIAQLPTYTASDFELL